MKLIFYDNNNSSSSSLSLISIFFSNSFSFISFLSKIISSFEFFGLKYEERVNNIKKVGKTLNILVIIINKQN